MKKKPSRPKPARWFLRVLPPLAIILVALPCRADEHTCVPGESPKAGYRQRRVSFPSPKPSGNVRNDVVWCDYYTPITPGPHPAMLVLHAFRTKAGHKERDLCRAAARNGIVTLLMTLPYHMARRSAEAGPKQLLADDATRALEAFRQATADGLAAVDWLARQSEVNTHRLGLVGLSLGTFIGVRVMANEPRLRFGVLILGGGGLDVLIKDSLIGQALFQAMVRRGGNPLEALPKLLELDPVSYADKLRDRRLLMINGLYDTIIPPAAATRLWERLGRPELIWIPIGHQGAVLFRALLIEEGLRFVQQAVRDEPRAPPQVRFRNLFSPKLSLVGTRNGEVRPAVVGELFRFDARGRFAFDLGLMPTRLLAGVSFNTGTLQRYGWTDLGIGVAVNRHGRGEPYLAFGFHF